MSDQDDTLCADLRHALRAACAGADIRFLEHARALIRALCSTIDLRAAVMRAGGSSPRLASRAAAIIMAANADVVGWRADACDLIDEAEKR